MSEKKMVSRSVAVALGIICILLIALVAYFSVAGILAQNSYNNLQNQNKQLQTWLDGNKTLLLQTQTWLDDNITYYSSQITNLTNQFTGSLAKPLLGFSDLTAEDNRTVPETPYLHINGTLNNFGIERIGIGRTTLGYLDVEAYQNNDQTAIQNETIFWDGINGQSSIKVDLKFPYNGSALTSWTIVLSLAIFI